MSCIVKNCKNYRNKRIEGISFHRFPRNVDMFGRWVRILKLKEDFGWSRYKLICSKHFNASDIIKTNNQNEEQARSFLKINAVPSHFLDAYESDPLAMDIKTEEPDLLDNCNYGQKEEFYNEVSLKTEEFSSLKNGYEIEETDVGDNYAQNEEFPNEMSVKTEKSSMFENGECLSSNICEDFEDLKEGIEIGAPVLFDGNHVKSENFVDKIEIDPENCNDVNEEEADEDSNEGNDFSTSDVLEQYEENSDGAKCVQLKTIQCKCCDFVTNKIWNMKRHVQVVHMGLKKWKLGSKNEDIHDIIEEAASKEKNCSLLPEKSKIFYERAYAEYVKWCDMKKKMIQNYHSEKSLLAYFFHLSKDKKPSSLWSYYSMLKATIKINHDVDISNYPSLFGFLKKKSDGYKPKKSKVFTMEDIESFIYQAPDEMFLMNKVALILGCFGACRKQELVRLEVDNFQDLGSSLLVTLRDSMRKKIRTFSVPNNTKQPSFLDIYRKYVSLRPINTETRRFFLACRNGRCTRQVVGKNVFGEIPKKIATFLNLPNPELYTGHSFRSTATVLGSSEEGIIGMEQWEGCTSTAVVEYVDCGEFSIE